jgi:DeoR family transcriptional regulator, suf operon transcriptional repressor
MPETIISAAGLRVMKLLVGNPPQSVSDLTRAARVTRTAVTEQLNELVAAGFVERSTEHQAGRGRPRHLYKATNAALVLLFSSNQRLLVPAIWRAIREVAGDDSAAKILKRVSHAMAEHYGRAITAKKPRERLRQLIDVLTAEGGLIEVLETRLGQSVVFKRNCPFISMVDDERSVCYIDQEMMSAVVGRPVRQTACRHEGAPCCAFEIADS